MKIRITPAILLLTLLLAAASAGAATLNQLFMNDFESNGLYLWSVDAGNMSFESFTPGANMDAWKADVSAPDHLLLRGPTVAAGAGRFSLTMNYKATPFRLEWAEVMFDNVSTVVRGFGTLTFDGNGWSNAAVGNHVIDIPLHPQVAAMPLPAAWMLLFPALAFMALPGLRKRAMV